MTLWKILPAHLLVLSGALLTKPSTRLALLTLVMAFACWAQDPFSSLGSSAQRISTGTFVIGLVEFAIVIAGLLLAFSGRVLGGVLIAIVGGGMLALSINLKATLLGIDRRLCIVILIVTFLVFRHFTFLSALLVFALLWSGAYWLTKHDPELVVIVPKAFGQRGVYDPGKTTNKTSWKAGL